MNYENIYHEFINYFKHTTPINRLKMRNSSDKRLNAPLYTELHHIIPVNEGGKNSIDNLVEVLPEEHIFIHKLRYKAFGKRGDFLAVRGCLNGSKWSLRYKKDSMALTKNILRNYAWLRQHSADFRKEHGWQSNDGKRRISESRKGTMPVKDYITGEIIGSVPTNHPNVLSGIWVHHTKGRKMNPDEHKRRIENSTGHTNGNSYSVTDEEIIEAFLKICEKYKCIPSFPILKKESGLKIPTIHKGNFRFNGEGRLGLIKILEDKTGYTYNKYRKKY